LPRRGRPGEPAEALVGWALLVRIHVEAKSDLVQPLPLRGSSVEALEEGGEGALGLARFQAWEEHREAVGEPELLCDGEAEQPFEPLAVRRPEHVEPGPGGCAEVLAKQGERDGGHEPSLRHADFEDKGPIDECEEAQGVPSEAGAPCGVAFGVMAPLSTMPPLA